MMPALFGAVLAVHDFGAGDLLEIGDHFVPFTRAIVPEIDLANGRLTDAGLPPETEARAETDASDDKEGDNAMSGWRAFYYAVSGHARQFGA